MFSYVCKVQGWNCVRMHMHLKVETKKVVSSVLKSCIRGAF